MPYSPPPAAGVSLPVSIANGGTGQITQAAARTALGVNLYAGPVTIPTKAAQTTALNGIAAIATDTPQGIQLAPTASGSTWRGYFNAPPAAPWSYCARISINGVANGTQQVGILLRNSTNLRQVNWGPYSNVGVGEVLCQQWTNNVFVGNTITALSAAGGDPLWYRVDLSAGGTLTFFTSEDGYNWHAHTPTQTVASYLTAAGGGTLDQVGFGTFDYAGVISLISSASFSLPPNP
jgi:hypothetical protein